MRGRYGFAAMLAVVGFSIVLGMVLGGRFDAPPSAVAARSGEGALHVTRDAAPAPVPPIDFSEIVARSIPAVVSVNNTRIETPPSGSHSDDIFRFFFGEPDDPDQRQRVPRRGVSSGSGFLITPDGYILTNNHVVEGATKLEVTLDDGSRFTAEVIGTDPIIDLALVKIDAGDRVLPTLPLGDSDALRVGEWVIAIGNPLELEHTVTVGVVSAKGRSVNIGSTIGPLARFIQTDAAINFGNSGGPLLDARGRVVGINSAILRNGGPFNSPLIEGIGFALPINAAWDAAQQIRESGGVKRGYLGVTMNTEPIDDRAREYYGLPDTKGVLIKGVTPGGPADKGGVKPGDIIRKVDGEFVVDNEDLLVKVAGKRPGEKVRLEIFRNGKTVKTEVILAVRPADPTAGGPIDVPDAEPDAEEPISFGFRVGAIDERMRRHTGADDTVRGVMIVEVDPESDAAEQGLVPGLIIQSVNDRQVPDLPAWRAATREIDPGAVVKLDLWLPGDTTRSVFVRVPKRSAP
jgi:serine protease Do